MLSDANATADITPDDVEAEVEELVAPNKEWRWGDTANSTVTLRLEEPGQQRGEKMRSGGIRDMLRVLKKGAGATLPPTAVDAEEQQRQHRHHEPPAPLLSPENFQSTTSLSASSSAGSRCQYYPIYCPESPRHDERTSRVLVQSLYGLRRNPEHARRRRFTQHLSPLRNLRLVDCRSLLFSAILVGRKDLLVYTIIPSSATMAGDGEAHSTTDTGTGDSSSNTAEEEDWDRMDSASDIDAAANALQLADSAMVRGGVHRKPSKNKKGRGPYLQDSRAHTVHLLVMQKRSLSAWRLRFSNSRHRRRVTLELNNLCSRCSYRTLTRLIFRILPCYQRRQRHPDHCQGFQARLRLRLTHNRIRYAPNPHTFPPLPPCPSSLQLRFLFPSSSPTMPVLSSPGSGITTAADWKLAMTPENIKPLLENARGPFAVVEELGRLRETVVGC